MSQCNRRAPTLTLFDGDGLTWWEEVNTYGLDPTVKDLDTDGDLIPDWWEDKYGFDLNDSTDAGLDATLDNDGLTNLEEFWAGRAIPTSIDNGNFISRQSYDFGGNPRKQDIFVEVDWMTGHEMTDEAQYKVIGAFAKQNIHLWIDDGWMGGGQDIGYSEFITFGDTDPDNPTYPDFYTDYKNNGFFSINRLGIFHYAIFCDKSWAMSEGIFTSNRIGLAEAIGGNDFIVCTGYSKNTFMHELGHDLGLMHSMEKAGTFNYPQYYDTKSEAKQTIMYYQSGSSTNDYDELWQEISYGGVNDSD